MYFRWAVKKFFFSIGSCKMSNKLSLADLGRCKISLSWAGTNHFFSELHTFIKSLSSANLQLVKPDRESWADSELTALGKVLKILNMQSRFRTLLSYLLLDVILRITWKGMIVFPGGPPLYFLRAFVYLQASSIFWPNYDRRSSES